MQLLWFRYNFASKERLALIKEIGCSVYEDKPTLGKSKKKSIEEQKTEEVTKKDEVVMATGGDNSEIRLFSKAWFARNCWWMIPLAIGVIVAIGYFIFM